jgi:hypothetical protein
MLCFNFDDFFYPTANLGRIQHFFLTEAGYEEVMGYLSRGDLAIGAINVESLGGTSAEE